jgi:hypothetical protein
MLTKTEYDNIFRYFDKNCDDEVSFAEFIAFLRSKSGFLIWKSRWIKIEMQSWTKFSICWTRFNKTWWALIS